MTGGTVVILGKIGFNFGAGMTGGKAIVLNHQKDFNQYISTTAPQHKKPTETDLLDLKSLIELHIKKTNSQVGIELLEKESEWENMFYIFGGLDEKQVFEKIKKSDKKTSVSLD